jgi:hypothetical protein
MVSGITGEPTGALNEPSAQQSPALGDHISDSQPGGPLEKYIDF